jgi:hypothetical protein
MNKVESKAICVLSCRRDKNKTNLARHYVMIEVSDD